MGYREVLVPVESLAEARRVRKRAKETNGDLIVYCNTRAKRDLRGICKGDIFVVLGGWNEAFLNFSGDKRRYVPRCYFQIDDVLSPNWYSEPDLAYEDVFRDFDPEEGVKLRGTVEDEADEAPGFYEGDDPFDAVAAF